jgi:hypothetical protein
MMKRPPKFVQGFVDRHGRPRFYFRRPGFDRVPLPGLPWSPEFMAAYETALAGQPMQVASASVKPGTMRALAVLVLQLRCVPIDEGEHTRRLSQHHRSIL